MALKPGQAAPDWLLVETRMDMHRHWLKPLGQWEPDVVRISVCGQIVATYDPAPGDPKPLCSKCKLKGQP